MQTRTSSSFVPRYRQLAEQIRRSIESGELPPGSRLPSSRVLAQEQGVSRATVENALGELVAQGWLERRSRSGTYVSAALSARPVRPLQKGVDRRHPAPLPFQPGLPALDAFPRGLWARVMGRCLRQQSRFDLALPDPAGNWALRQAIADWLRFSRSIDCRPEQVFIAAGYPMVMTLLLRALARQGDEIWVEDPGYPFIRPVLKQNGLRLKPVPVDGEGMVIDEAIRRYPDARFALLTPAHQSPLGVALAASRRRQLLAWAVQRDAWIIEDDYDSEFRYQGRPLPPLKSLDAPRRVIYAGTFSKTLFPALRCGWLVVPEEVTNAFAGQSVLTPCSVPPLIQLAISDFIGEGHFWRHLKKMRQIYTQRRRWLEQALAEQGFPVVPQAGGIQLLMPVTGDDRTAAARARDAGLAVEALGAWRLESQGEGGLIMSFTNIASARHAEELAARLHRALL
jgi:GntR family transcriptional regulator/MocR family aminotransferase